MGYSPEFIRGILSLVTIGAVVGLVAATADALLSLGLFDGDYPGGSGFGGFVVALLAVIAVCWALNVLVGRVYR